MNQAALDAFRQQTQTAFVAARPGTIVYNSVSYPASVQRGTVQVELDHGPANLAGITATVDKADMATAPQVGKRITESGVSFEIFEVGGEKSTRWLIRAATFPAKRK